MCTPAHYCLNPLSQSCGSSSMHKSMQNKEGMSNQHVFCACSWWENVRGQWPNWIKMTGRRHVTQPTIHCGRVPVLVHTWFHSCQLKNIKVRQQWAQTHQKWTVDFCKKLLQLEGDNQMEPVEWHLRHMKMSLLARASNFHESLCLHLPPKGIRFSCSSICNVREDWINLGETA